MITREEYNKALDIVEQYHKQIFKMRDKKTPLINWMNSHDCPGRLRTILKRLHIYEGIEYVEDVNEFNFLALHKAGSTSWKQFKRIREKD